MNFLMKFDTLRYPTASLTSVMVISRRSTSNVQARRILKSVTYSLKASPVIVLTMELI